MLSLAALETWWWPLAIVFVAYLVLGIAGFGSALVSVPLLAFIWPLPEVVGLVLLMDIPTSLLLGGLNLKAVRLGMIRRLVPGLLLGSALGLWLLGSLDRRWPLAVLGVYVIGVGVQWLRGKTPPAQGLSPLQFHGLSGLIGIIEIMFGTAGPVVLAMLRRLFHDVMTVRATAPVVMVGASVLAVVTLWATEAFSLAVVGERWIYTAPVAGLAVVVGNHFAHRIPAPVMVRLVAGLLMVSGASLTRWVWA